MMVAYYMPAVYDHLLYYYLLHVWQFTLLYKSAVYLLRRAFVRRLILLYMLMSDSQDVSSRAYLCYDIHCSYNCSCPTWEHLISCHKTYYIIFIQLSILSLIIINLTILPYLVSQLLLSCSYKPVTSVQIFRYLVVCLFFLRPILREIGQNLISLFL